MTCGGDQGVGVNVDVGLCLLIFESLQEETGTAYTILGSSGTDGLDSPSPSSPPCRRRGLSHKGREVRYAARRFKGQVCERVRDVRTVRLGRST